LSKTNASGNNLCSDKKEADMKKTKQRTANKIESPRRPDLGAREGEDTFTWVQLCYLADAFGIWPQANTEKGAALKFRKFLLNSGRFENTERGIWRLKQFDGTLLPRVA